MNKPINRDTVESAVHYLAETAEDYAKAKGRRVYLDEHRKSVKSALILQAPEGPVAMREAWAYNHADYRKIVSDIEDAVVTEETLRAFRNGAEARICVWRTLEATKRAENIT